MLNKKIKLLYTIPNFDTAGSGKALLKIAKGLDKNIFEPHICCFHDRGYFFEEVRKSGIPVHIFKYTATARPVTRLLKESVKVSQFFKQGQYDLIHSFHYSDDYTEALAARMAGVKWVYTKKNMNWNTRAFRLRSWLASGIIAQNTDMVQDFFAGKKKVKLIPRGVDVDEFTIMPPSEKLFKEFGLESNSRVILCVANLVPVKGVEYLIDAFNKVATSHNDVYLFIVGDDRETYADQLKKQARAMDHGSRIIFTGKRADIKAFHSIAHTFVLPTLNEGRQEGSPVSLLEAMAAGTPVIASNVAGVRDQLKDLFGQLFEPKNVEQLARKLAEFLNYTPLQRQKIIDRQIQVVNERYAIGREIAEHQEFYKNVIHHSF